MEGLHELFLDVYQRFLLRDFVGKIVPGLVVIVSYSGSSHSRRS
jgi:hypothetical protein